MRPKIVPRALGICTEFKEDITVRSIRAEEFLIVCLAGFATSYFQCVCVCTYRDVDVKLDERIACPAAAVEEVHQRQEEWHVLHTLGPDHFTLQISSTILLLLS